MRRTILVSGILPFVMAVLGTVVTMSFLLPAQAGAQQSWLRTEGVTVVGDNGADRVRLDTGPGINAAVRVLDADGVRRVTLSAGAGRAGQDPDAAGLTVWDRDGVTAVGNLRMQEGGARILTLHDQQDRVRVSIRVEEDGTPSIRLRDADGNVTWTAP